MVYQQINTPSLLLDEHRCKSNILRICQKVKEQGVSLRPHFKTHQSLKVGRWFRELEIDRITVSSVGMASYFATDGWDDITIAFPVNVRQIEEIAELSKKIKLGLLLTDESAIEILGNTLHREVSIWIKIDVGTNRTGLAHTDTGGIERMLDRLKPYPQLHFVGFLAHAGHSYLGRSVMDAQRTYDQSLKMLLDLKRRYQGAFPGLKISLGDTPGASMVDQFGPVDELRPGNFVFYDLMQEQIGACTLDDIAVAMACPVVAVHPDRKQWIIYGGAVHFSKDYLLLPGGTKTYGRMVDQNLESWSVDNTDQHPVIISLSQEHGVVQCSDENFEQCKPGDIALWLPVHSCLTADAMGNYIDTHGKMIDHYRQRAHPL